MASPALVIKSSGELPLSLTHTLEVRRDPPTKVYHMPQSPWTALLCACGAIAAQWVLTGQSGQALTQDLLPELDLLSVSSAFLAFGSGVGSAVNWPGMGRGAESRDARQEQTTSSSDSSPAPDIQPDEVRAQSRPLAKDSPEMRCFEALPPWSISSTHDVEIYVESQFVSGPSDEDNVEEAARSEYQFKYHVEFKNVGVDTVQMLSRHWVFGDAAGRTSEVKGPGAVGKTPILQPGESWSYDSGTRIRTPTGSIAGSFQFAVLDDVSGMGVSSFNARVSRLSLTEERRPVRVPCVDEASIGQLPPTSVHSTQRVIVGVTSEPFQRDGGDDEDAEPDAEAGFIFKYDAQINNAHTEAVRVRDAYWEFTDNSGKITTHRGAAYRGEQRSVQGPVIAAGGAYRGAYTIGFVVLATPVGNAEGFFTVEMMKSGGECRNLKSDSCNDSIRILVLATH